jgi:hypothetical protein
VVWRVALPFTQEEGFSTGLKRHKPSSSQSLCWWHRSSLTGNDVLTYMTEDFVYHFISYPQFQATRLSMWSTRSSSTCTLPEEVIPISVVRSVHSSIWRMRIPVPEAPLLTTQSHTFWLCETKWMDTCCEASSKNTAWCSPAEKWKYPMERKGYVGVTKRTRLQAKRWRYSGKETGTCSH